MSERDTLPKSMIKIVEKPWGREEWLVVGRRIVMKRLVIRAGQRLSLQYHQEKEEAWLIVRGTAEIRFQETTGALEPGDVLHLLPGTVHRIGARDEDVELLEASTPELADVVRVEDDFGRSGS